MLAFSPFMAIVLAFFLLAIYNLPLPTIILMWESKFIFRVTPSSVHHSEELFLDSRDPDKPHSDKLKGRAKLEMSSRLLEAMAQGIETTRKPQAYNQTRKHGFPTRQRYSSWWQRLSWSWRFWRNAHPHTRRSWARKGRWCVC